MNSALLAYNIGTHYMNDSQCLCPNLEQSLSRVTSAESLTTFQNRLKTCLNERTVNNYWS